MSKTLIHETECGLTQENLVHRFRYDAASGTLWWKISPCPRIKVGDPVGGICGQGYRRVFLGGRNHFQHRIIWLYAYGEWPPGHIDHINNNRLDNRLENLRIATDSQNAVNKPKTAHTESSPLRGVTRLPSGRWQAQIQCDGKNNYLGAFDTAIEAHDAYSVAADRMFGEFARAS